MALEEKDVYLNRRDTFSLACFFFYDSDCPVSRHQEPFLPSYFFLLLLNGWMGVGERGWLVVACRAIIVFPISGRFLFFTAPADRQVRQFTRGVGTKSVVPFS